MARVDLRFARSRARAALAGRLPSADLSAGGFRRPWTWRTLWSGGFEIETELTIHALELRMPYGEVATPYGVRPEGSASKLRTYSDGIRILSTIIRLFAVEKPLRFYAWVSLLLALVSLGLAVPLILTWLQTGLVPRFPTAILSAGIGILSGLSLTAGLILETVTIGRRETRHLHYLASGSVPADLLD